MYRHTLKILFEGVETPLFLGVRDSELERLQSVIDRFGPDGARHEYFWCDTVDGKSVAFNLNFVQTLHFLWDPSLPPDLTRYEGPIEIWLKGRNEPVELLDTDVPDQLFDFFSNLEHGPDVVPFPYFEDEDGETIWVNATHVLYVVAPSHLVDEGRRMANEQDAIE